MHSRIRTILLHFFTLTLIPSVQGQTPVISRIQPDILAPGMSATVEILSRVNERGSFGTDGIYLPDEKIVFVNKNDTNRVILGPVVVSWQGRVLQVPITVLPTSPLGIIQFQIRNNQLTSTSIRLEIRSPQQSISITGTGVLGEPQLGTGSLSNGNTFLVEELDLQGTIGSGLRDRISMSLKTPDPLLSGNPRYNPFIILVRRQVRLTDVELTVSADSINGGPGGGGGGAGLGGVGGIGYTGGGSDSSESSVTFGNIGSGGGPSIDAGGPSLTDVKGGKNDYFDQGGGGGTGIAFGISGDKGGQHSSSPLGGFGAGSAGGEEPGLPYGGGGGGFAEAGQPGAGIGNNGGRVSGGRFVVPLQGGSGGGGGNCYECTTDTSVQAGAGGGGGGAISIVSYESIIMSNAGIMANGARGTSAKSPRISGGGGGSGGAIVLAARDSIFFHNSQLQSAGGQGGAGGPGIESASRGGDGGIGFVRIDGDRKGAPSLQIIGKDVSAPMLVVPKTAQRGPVITLRGMAGIGQGLSDTIRIYYRTVRTKWTYVDTITAGSRWQKDIALDYDSTLYVTVMQKVRSPKRDTANFEPDFLLSHLSSGIIPIVPRVLLAYSDTLKLGCIKIGECVRGIISLANKGGKRALIDSVHIDHPDFTLSSRPSEMRPYSNDSIIVEFCPTATGTLPTELIIYEQDTTARIVIIGCGTDRDERISITPNPLTFGNLLVDSCTVRQAVVRALADSVTIAPEQFSSNGFTLLQPLAPVRLGKGDALTVIIRVCITDSGDVRGSFILTSRRDSLITTAYGLRRELLVPDTIDAGIHCLGQCFDQPIRLRSTGNTNVRIDSITGVEVVSTVLPITLLPTEEREIVVRICQTSIGDSYVTATYHTNASEIKPTVIHFNNHSAVVVMNTVFDKPMICVGSCDTLIGFVSNPGAEAVTIDSVWLAKGIDFLISHISTPRVINGSDSLLVEAYYCSVAEGTHSDTIYIRSISAQCDTVLSFALGGMSVRNEPIFSSKILDFGIVDTGLCKRDSVRIDNPCVSDITLTVSDVSGNYKLVNSDQPIVIKGGSSRTVLIEYCPLDSISDNSNITFTDEKLTDYTIIVRGKGRVKTSQPYIAFSLPQSTAVAGERFVYPVLIDSVKDLFAIDTLRMTLTYDPRVVIPTAIRTNITGAVVSGVESSIGRYDILVTTISQVSKGEICGVEFLPLISMKTSTVTAVSNILLPSVQTHSTQGFIAVERCAEPPQNLVIPGVFVLGTPTPNPMMTSAHVPVRMGIDGDLLLRLYDQTGALIWRKVYPLTEGAHTILLTAENIPSGSYHLEAESWGWKSSTKLMITR